MVRTAKINNANCMLSAWIEGAAHDVYVRGIEFRGQKFTSRKGRSDLTHSILQTVRANSRRTVSKSAQQMSAFLDNQSRALCNHPSDFLGTEECVEIGRASCRESVD